MKKALLKLIEESREFYSSRADILDYICTKVFGTSYFTLINEDEITTPSFNTELTTPGVAGRVTRYNPIRGFGFASTQLKNSDGELYDEDKIFIHCSNIHYESWMGERAYLQPEWEIQFDLHKGERGLSAKNIRVKRRE